VLYSLSHLQHERGCGSEHGARTTGNLDGGASELRGLGRRRGGSNRYAASGLDRHSGVVWACRRSRRQAGAVRGSSSVGTLHGEVGAANAGLVGQVEHKGELSKVGGVTHLCGQEGVDVSI
jgi:hypothetical protein